MEDPHVVALYYKVIVREGYSYKNPPAVKVQTAEFDGTLDAGLFVAKMLQHYPTTEDARVPVDNYLRAWEISAGLRRGEAVLKFDFDHPEIIDRTPPKPGEARAYLNAMLGRVTVTATATAHMEMFSYPAPPIDFAVVPMVETMWRRYERYFSGQEPLFAMAYFCLTLLENSQPSKANGRAAAARCFNIDVDILKKIGELTSNRGDENDARKASESMAPATGPEIAWLRDAIKSVIKQVATVEAGNINSRLSMSDLPPL